MSSKPTNYGPTIQSPIPGKIQYQTLKKSAGTLNPDHRVQGNRNNSVAK